MKLSSGARLEIFDRLDSTSAEAKRRAENGEHGPVWILAREQTGGYGRRGRHWDSGFGNFTATYLFEPGGDPSRHGQLSFVAALGVIEALDRYVAPGALCLKWPNDVLAGSDKIAGILLESVTQNKRSVVCMGIGVNLRSAPLNVDYPTARLADNLRVGAETPDAEEFAARVDDQFAAYYDMWRRSGFAPIREAWLERAKGIGSIIRVRLPAEEFSGVFEDLDADGALLLRNSDGQRRISAGEIMFGE